MKLFHIKHKQKQSLSRQVPLLQHEVDERVIPHQTKPNSLVILRCYSVAIPHQTKPNSLAILRCTSSLVIFRCSNMKLTREREKNTDSMLTILVNIESVVYSRSFALWRRAFALWRRYQWYYNGWSAHELPEADLPLPHQCHQGHPFQYEGKSTAVSHGGWSLSSWATLLNNGAPWWYHLIITIQTNTSLLTLIYWSVWY